MRPNLWIVVWCVGCVAAPQGEDMTFPRVPPDDYRQCDASSTCVVVETACSYCCDFHAINADFEEEWTHTLRKRCAGYSGVMCDCDGPDEALCVEGLCEVQLE
jgi:hypothetical protein